jgi:hypothetical protein
VRTGIIRAGFAYRTPPNGSRRLALGHFKAPLQVPAQARRHRRSPAEAERRWRGRGASREGSVSVGQCIALSKAEVERKRTPTPIISWPVRGSSPLTCPGIPAGGYGLLPQLQARERAAHTGTVSEQCLESNRAKFSRQLKRISVQMDSVVRVSPPQPASPSPLRHRGRSHKNRAVPRGFAVARRISKRRGSASSG